MAYHRYHKVDTRIVRIFNTYGPRMRINDGRVVPNFIGQALRGEDITVYGDGSQTRSFCYVSDEVEGIYRLMMSDYTLPVNVGNPEEHTILEFARIILKMIGANRRSFLRTCQWMIRSRGDLILPKRGNCWVGAEGWTG